MTASAIHRSLMPLLEVVHSLHPASVDANPVQRISSTWHLSRGLTLGAAASVPVPSTTPSSVLLRPAFIEIPVQRKPSTLPLSPSLTSSTMIRLQCSSSPLERASSPNDLAFNLTFDLTFDLAFDLTLDLTNFGRRSSAVARPMTLKTLEARWRMRQ